MRRNKERKVVEKWQDGRCGGGGGGGEMERMQMIWCGTAPVPISGRGRRFFLEGVGRGVSRKRRE